ncbi:polysaccharide deacetylase [Pseudomonas oryzihabitans]|uniref:polysaccharide deacetylase family protein n=1 Tax=Pseudomonas oryzihabitans TaxID=47885 RepID=UPI00165DF2DB|nr:polysaccharide deacetylase family protein [Pseudomonas psychrotolerans]QNQ99918.1 polysaccharide deacetylase [Pseudomonas psychrotolerans]
MTPQALLKQLVGGLYLATLAQRQLRTAGTILMLHRVLANDQLASPPHRAALCLGQPTFARLLDWIGAHFDCVPLEELLQPGAGRRPRLALTFDDGWRDNAELAFPLLRQWGLPASIFLSTDHIGTGKPFWWEAIGELLWQAPDNHAAGPLLARLAELDHRAPARLLQTDPSQTRSRLLGNYLAQLKQLPPAQLNELAALCPPAAQPHALDWEQVRALERSGLVRFGPHGAAHAILTQLTPTALQLELERSQRTLAAECVHPLPIYCYPNGDHDAGVREAITQLGYRFALGTAAGLVKPDSPRLALPRVDVGQATAQRPGRLGWRLLKAARG